jgi:hypothetical protein
MHVQDKLGVKAILSICTFIDHFKSPKTLDGQPPPGMVDFEKSARKTD